LSGPSESGPGMMLFLQVEMMLSPAVVFVVTAFII